MENGNKMITEYKGFFIVTNPKGSRDSETSIIYADIGLSRMVGATASGMQKDEKSSIEKAKSKIDLKC